MRLLPGTQITFSSPMGPIEIHRKLGEVTRKDGVIDTDPLSTAKPHYDGRFDDDGFRLVDRNNPSYYGWVVLAGAVTPLPMSVGGTTVEVHTAMHPRTTNIRFGFWAAWIFILIVMLTGAYYIPVSGWLWMALFAAALAGMHYLDYRSCVRETEYIRRLLQGTEPH